MALRVKNLKLSFGDKVVLQNLSFEISSGTLFCLLGPSGCGKSTLLRSVAGLQNPDSGEIHIHDRSCFDARTCVDPHRRQVGLVFQDALLFPHHNVRENVGFGLQGRSPKERERIVDRWLELFALKDQARQRPHELSGGQAQRVALARALAPGPKLLLLDEPFSNLDSELKERLKDELRRLQKKENITTVFVTHDQHEAFDLADEIGVMRDGKLVQQGAGYSVYHEPKNPWVAKFLGRAAFVHVQTKKGGDGLSQVSSPLGPLIYRGDWAGSEALLLVRPDDVVHDDSAPASGRVVKRNFRGIYQILHLELDDGTLIQSMAPSHHDHQIGERVGLRLEMDHVVLFPVSS